MSVYFSNLVRAIGKDVAELQPLRDDIAKILGGATLFERTALFEPAKDDYGFSHEGHRDIFKFQFVTNYRNGLDEVKKASQRYPSLIFHISSGRVDPDPYLFFEDIVQNGEVYEKLMRQTDGQLCLNSVLYPHISLWRAHLGLSEPEVMQEHIRQAAHIIEDITHILDTFKQLAEAAANDTLEVDAFPRVLGVGRDWGKFNKTLATLNQLHGQITRVAEENDFKGVIIPYNELPWVTPYDEDRDNDPTTALVLNMKPDEGADEQ